MGDVQCSIEISVRVREEGVIFIFLCIYIILLCSFHDYIELNVTVIKIMKYNAITKILYQISSGLDS